MKNATNLQQIIDNPNTEWIDVNFTRTKIGDEGAIILARALENHSQLQKLDLLQNQIGDEGAIALARALENHSQLQILHLNNNHIRIDHELKGTLSLISATPKLNTLNLNYNEIGIKGAIALIEAMSKHSHLKELHLSCNKITYEEVISLATAIGSSSITELNLDHNFIDDEGAITLIETLGSIDTTSEADYS